MKKVYSFLSLVAVLQLSAQDKPAEKREPGHGDNNKFSQMYDLLATPNMFRTASGAPGPAYYQQQADYKMDIELDDKNTKIFTITIRPKTWSIYGCSWTRTKTPGHRSRHWLKAKKWTLPINRQAFHSAF
jgi:hypothetical protein